MEIRSFIPTDAERVSLLIQHTIATVNTKDYTPEALEPIAARYTPDKLLESKGDIFVACEGNDILGTATITGDEVTGVFVNAFLINRGVGRQLMETVERTAAANGVRRTRLSSSLTARGFYARLGYRTDKADADVIHMSKKL